MATSQNMTAKWPSFGAGNRKSIVVYFGFILLDQQGCQQLRILDLLLPAKYFLSPNIFLGFFFGLNFMTPWNRPVPWWADGTGLTVVSYQGKTKRANYISG